MSFHVREQSWAQLKNQFGMVVFDVHRTTVDYGDGTPIVEALRFEAPYSAGGPFTVHTEDLRQLVQLLERNPEALSDGPIPVAGGAASGSREQAA